MEPFSLWHDPVFLVLLGIFIGAFMMRMPHGGAGSDGACRENAKQEKDWTVDATDGV